MLFSVDNGVYKLTNCFNWNVYCSILDDERILVFVQPIYSITEEKFKTGETLMRMNISGKM